MFIVLYRRRYTGWAINQTIFYKFVTPVCDDVERRFLYIKMFRSIS